VNGPERRRARQLGRVPCRRGVQLLRVSRRAAGDELDFVSAHVAFPTWPAEGDRIAARALAARTAAESVSMS
jgi:hypothetical protein